MLLVFHWAKAPQSWDRSITNSTHRLSRCAFVASTGASLAASVSAGLSALSGPRHGGQTSLVEILFEESERFGDAARLVHALRVVLASF